jgi:hypothetical protein
MVVVGGDFVAAGRVSFGQLVTNVATILELDSRIDAYLFHDGDDDDNARWMGYSSMAREALAASRSASSLALSAA